MYAANVLFILIDYIAENKYHRKLESNHNSSNNDENIPYRYSKYDKWNFDIYSSLSALNK